VLEFHAGRDSARVVGRALTSDVVLNDAGVLPVHCYFEREDGEIWLAAAQSDAALRVNYQPVASRTKLGRRCIVEVGDARLQVTLVEAEEESPHHGPFGTEVIDLRAPRVPLDLFETKPVDTAVALGEFPTATWSDLELDESLIATTTWQRDEEHEELALAVAAPRGQGAQNLNITQRIPPVVDVVQPARPAIEPVKALPCVLIESRNRLSPAPAPAIAAGGSSPEGRVALPDSEVFGHGALPREASAIEVPQVLLSQDAPTLAQVRLPEQRQIVDAGSFITVGHPIPDLLAAPESNAKNRGAQPPSDFAALRQRFAAGPGREPKVVVAIAILAALSLSALVSQAVRGWRYIVNAPVVTYASAPQSTVHSTRVSIVAPPRASASTAPPASASGAPAVQTDPSQRSVEDPLVDQAVDHLLAGRQAEAAEAYAALAVRYPSENMYAVAAKILRRRLSPACQQGIANECGKGLK